MSKEWHYKPIYAGHSSGQPIIRAYQIYARSMSGEWEDIAETLSEEEARAACRETDLIPLDKSGDKSDACGI